MEIFKERKFPEQLIISVHEGLKNSIEEIMLFKSEIKERGLLEGPIVVVCDRSHARRLKLLWKKISPTTVIRIQNIDGVFSNKNRVYIQQSSLLWLVANMLHNLILLLPGGLSWTRNVTHPIE